MTLQNDIENETGLPDAGGLKEIFANRGKSPRKQDERPFILAHEMPHSLPAHIGVGKTSITKALAQELGYDLIEIDASKLDSSADLSRLLGHPPGYVPKLTPEQEAGLAAGLDGLKEEWRLAASRKSGEELAAACHGGVSQETACLKPFRLKDASNGFMTAGAYWQ